MQVSSRGSQGALSLVLLMATAAAIVAFEIFTFRVGPDDRDGNWACVRDYLPRTDKLLFQPC